MCHSSIRPPISRYVIAHDQFTRPSPASNGVRRPGYEAIVSTYSRGNHSNSDPILELLEITRDYWRLVEITLEIKEITGD